MAVETIKPGEYTQANLWDLVPDNGYHPNGRIIEVEVSSPNGVSPVSPVEFTSEVVEINPAAEFKQRITAALFEDRQKLETLYPGIGFDLGELRRRIGEENDQKKGFKAQLKAELAGWIRDNDQGVLVTPSGRKRKTTSSIQRAARRVAGQILAHCRKDLSGLEEYAAHFQADAEKSQQLQALKGQITDFNDYRRQLGRHHRQASYYLRDALELDIWRNYIDGHQLIHKDYNLATGLLNTFQAGVTTSFGYYPATSKIYRQSIPPASELVTKVETVIPAEVRSGKQPRNKLRRELWQYAKELEQVRTQQKIASTPKNAPGRSPTTVQEVVESSNKRLAKIAAFIGVPAAVGGLALLINQFLKNPHQVIEQKSADPDEGLRSPETDFPAEGTLVFEPPKPTHHFLERFGRDNVMISEETVYDPISQDQARPTFPPTITPTADNPVEVFNTNRLEARVTRVVEDTQRVVAAETPILHPAGIAAIQREIDEKNKATTTPTATSVPTQIPTSTLIPVSTPTSTPAKPTFSVASVESRTSTTAPTATKAPVVEKKVQPATPTTARPAENKPISSMDKPRGRFGISQREIESRRLIAYENAPKSCMDILAEVEEEIARLGDRIQVYDADRGIMTIQSPRQVLGIGMAVIAAEDATCTGQSESPLQSVGWWQLHRLSHKTWIEKDFRLPFDVVAKHIKHATRAALQLLPVRSEYGGWAAWDVCAKGAKDFLLSTIGRIVNCEP